MKKIILSISDAPATGRTTACELVQGVWRHQGLDHGRWHTAAEQPPGPGRSRYVDLGTRLSEDDVISWLDQVSLVMVDVATGDAASMIESYVRSDLPEILAEMDCTVTAMSVLNGQLKAEESLLQLAGLLRDDAEYVVIRRECAGSAWLLPACQRAMHHLGAFEVSLPDLPPLLAEASPENGTAHCVEWMAREAILPRVPKGWLRSWWMECDRQLESAADLLWPEGLDPGELSASLGMGGRGRRSSKKSTAA